MPVQTIADIRKSFLEFFESKQHLRLPSASLLPAGDPTLLFTTAGMVPFKDFFAATRKPPSSRVASVQKCLRTTDLESVGRTKRHLSFFEMLGNFSFGDYFKKEAIEFAWEYSTQFLPFPKEKIWISIFENDDEAFELWNKHIGVRADRIVRLGRADNFWGPAGESGACGPCSELYLDRGEEFGTDENNRAPGGSGDRFMEFWNLVFNQFDFQKGEYLPLAQTGIDTGAGLERLATLVQGVDSVFDTDELARLRDAAAKNFGVQYEGENTIPLRVVTDHIRTLCFAMSDGIYPSNESRGYVLRRVLRRAMLFGRRLSEREAKLHKLCDTVLDIYGDFYPELKKNMPFIQDYIAQEEKRFLHTLDSGAERLASLLAAAKEKKLAVVSGKDVFQLYDTFGFPLEMTLEIAEAENLAIDVVGFKAEMERQRERGRAAWKGALDLPLDTQQKTEFTGYTATEDEARVVSLIRGEERVKSVAENMPKDTLLFLVTDKTPFYAESGGQMGDTGSIRSARGSARVVDCRKQNDQFVHLLADVEGEISEGDAVSLIVDSERRAALTRHHSATHLLNAALRSVLGNHVTQRGSLVHPDYLRFDFSHPKAMTKDELVSVEKKVNDAVLANWKVETVELAKEEAEKRGAVMTFGEKYGDRVRVVEMSDFSKEFCGGTHVANTGDIGVFLLQKESSPGAGNRRIEAFAGAAARNQIERTLENLYSILDEERDIEETTRNLFKSDVQLLRQEKITPQTVGILWQKISALSEKVHDKIREGKKKKTKSAQEMKLQNKDELLHEIMSSKEQSERGINLAHLVLKEGTINDLKVLGDSAREKDGSCIFALFVETQGGGEGVFVFATTDAYAKENNLALNTILKEVPKEFSVTGGGKMELVQGKFRGEASRFYEYLKSVV